MPDVRDVNTSKAENPAVDVDSTAVREAVAKKVVAALRRVTLKDLRGRAGRYSWGYVEPAEAAWELLEEAVKGHRDEIARLAGVGLEDEAQATCEVVDEAIPHWGELVAEIGGAGTTP